jgi:hypothetical protein
MGRRSTVSTRHVDSDSPIELEAFNQASLSDEPRNVPIGPNIIDFRISLRPS